jgi:hypothetical protein
VEQVKHNLPIYIELLSPSPPAKFKIRKIFLSFFQKSRPPAKKKKSGKFLGFGNQLLADAEASGT